MFMDITKEDAESVVRNLGNSGNIAYNSLSMTLSRSLMGVPSNQSIIPRQSAYSSKP